MTSVRRANATSTNEVCLMALFHAVAWNFGRRRRFPARGRGQNSSGTPRVAPFFAPFADGTRKNWAKELPWIFLNCWTTLRRHVVGLTLVGVDSVDRAYLVCASWKRTNARDGHAPSNYPLREPVELTSSRCCCNSTKARTLTTAHCSHHKQVR